MKAILVGLGQAGFSWYKRLRDRGMIAAVIEPNEAMHSKIEDDAVPLYASLEEALDTVQADFLVNVTPPMVHRQVNFAAFDRKLPVLCEKPISFDWNESVEIVERAIKERIPFMIAENYRCMPIVRKLKQLIAEEAIGSISVIDITFSRYHQVKRRVFADLYNPIGGRRLHFKQKLRVR